jgi:hypothetical protein
VVAVAWRSACRLTISTVAISTVAVSTVITRGHHVASSPLSIIQLERVRAELLEAGGKSTSERRGLASLGVSAANAGDKLVEHDWRKAAREVALRNELGTLKMSAVGLGCVHALHDAFGVTGAAFRALELD